MFRFLRSLEAVLVIDFCWICRRQERQLRDLIERSYSNIVLTSERKKTEQIKNTRYI